MDPTPSPTTAAERLLADLDRDQRAAVMAPDGAVLVSAGAGSGKTRTLTHRVAYLIGARNVDPASIVAVTFTRKAADELRSRLGSLLERSGVTETAGLRVGTFHAICSAALRHEPVASLERVGRTRSFSIIDTKDRDRTIGRLLRAAGVDDVKPSLVGAFISRWKNEGITLADARSHAASREAIIAARIWDRYETALAEADAFDFDDLLAVPVFLMETDAAVRERWAAWVGHLLVDEFQDTNPLQMRLIDALTSVHHNLYVVGDDAQAIYGFRGARVEHFRGFAKRYSDARTYRLSTNYRSTQAICDVANALLREGGAKDRDLVSSRTDVAGRQATYRRLADETAEGRFLAGEVIRLRRAGVPADDLAILVRTNVQTRVIEASLRQYGIDFRLLGGTRFFDRSEIRDVVAYLRTLLNPRDAIAFRRALTTPRRGIGPALIDPIADRASGSGDWPAAIAAFAAGSEGNAKGRAGLRAFLANHERWTKLATSEAPASLVDAIIRESGLLELAEAESELEGDNRAENLRELVSAAVPYPAGSLERFVEAATLEAAADGDSEPGGRVTIATIHAAKGLEWRVVFVAGLEAGLLPSEKTGTDPAEERRLAYVAFTRAHRALVLTGAAVRAINGRREPRSLSPFLRDVRPVLGEAMPY